MPQPLVSDPMYCARSIPLVCGLLLSVGVAGAAPPPLSALQMDDRVLVVSPHPDDETLCCGGLIQQALAAGAAVAIVWITDGDGFEFDAVVVEHTLRPRSGGLLRLGAQRMREARAAAEMLGVPADRQYFLGYPDRGIAVLLDTSFEHDYRSRYTGASAVPYAGALSRGAAYTGANLQQDLSQVIDSFEPTLVLAAAPQDLHPDHAASGQLARRILEARGELPLLHYWIVHAGSHWPQPRHYRPQAPLQPPQIAALLSWTAVPVSETQRDRKLLALRQQHSQMRVMAPFLESFVRANELFAPAAP